VRKIIRISISVEKEKKEINPKLVTAPTPRNNPPSSDTKHFLRNFLKHFYSHNFTTVV